MKMDKYQQAYIDHNLTPKSVTRLVANSGCVDFNTVITIRTNDADVLKSLSKLLEGSGNAINNNNNTKNN